MESVNDKVIVHSWLEAIWHKKKEAVYALGGLAVAIIFLSLGKVDNVDAAANCGSGLIIVGSTLGVFWNSWKIMNWGFKHIPNRDRMEIKHLD